MGDLAEDTAIEGSDGRYRARLSRDWETREPADPSFLSWFRYLPRDTFDDPFVDAGRSLLLADTVGWPAATRTYRSDMAYYAPSIDVTVRFHACARESPWLLVEGRSPVARDGLVASAVSVWSADGSLQASGSRIRNNCALGVSPSASADSARCGGIVVRPV